MRKRLRVLVLVHEDLVPPESIEGLSDVETAPWKTEYDVTVTLRELGHEVLPLGVGSDLGVLRTAIFDFKPQITFNLLEEFHGVAVYDQHVVSYLELMKRRYTGCNPRGLMIAHDKALSKQILSYHRIRVPEFVVLPLGRKVRRPRRLEFPLLVKSLTEEGSVGIAKASLVNDDVQLRERTEFVQRQLGTDVIAERYVPGRELYVKWDAKYQKKLGVKPQEAKDLSPPLQHKIVRMCRRAYRTLNLSGYARMDLRLTPGGEVFMLEANPNPQLSYGEDFAESAEAAGLSYERLLQRILSLGMSYRALWQD
jgi:D-alanine-D-alanine ligase